MSLSNAQLEYLSEVLGLQQIVKPVGFTQSSISRVTTEPILNPVIEGTSSAYVVVTKPLSNKEKELLSKMLAAAKITDFAVNEVSSVSELNSVSLYTKTCYLVFESEYMSKFSGVRSYGFNSLEQLNDSSNLNKQKTLKLKAWNMLKGLLN